MKSVLGLVLLCTLAATTVGCKTIRESAASPGTRPKVAAESIVDADPESFIRIGESFRLSEQEVEDLRVRSMSEGGADAAWKLRQYYAFYVKDREMAAIWRKRAAELGHHDARRLIDEDRYKLTWEENMAIYPDIYGDPQSPTDDDAPHDNAFEVVPTP